MLGRYDCGCQRRRRVVFEDGKTLVNGVDVSAYRDVEEAAEAPECVFGCGKPMAFTPYDPSSVYVGRYSAMNADDKRRTLQKRKEAYDRSNEGRNMARQANYAQTGTEDASKFT